MFFAALLAKMFFLTLRISPSAGSFPKPLTPQQEHEALERMAAGDEQARALLIEHNLRLVAHVVKKYYAGREDQDDLVSIGTIGLIKAISSFDSSKNIKLATYACKCIENEILMYFRTLKKQSLEVSLCEPIDSDKDGNALSLLDVICCEDRMLEEIELSDQQRHLWRCIRTALDERERKIICLRYGLCNIPSLTQREVAAHCGISRSYVSRIEKRALTKLQQAFKD
ncbi:MAG: RNA polymerase sporulation sigma factor SigK [Clostridiaceae bacterium]|nr:RNA polymerase sporulation sigma factor SigK [Clostridiaceae bacterium]